jgi:dihydrodipicolinate synthase/N-acetylneuraminate lyase
MSKTITEPKTVARMAELREIIAVKDSWGDMTRFQQLLAIKHTRPNFEVYQGAEGVTAISIARGANGGVLGLANVAPKLCCDIYAAARAGDWQRAWQMQERLMTLWQLHTHGQWLPCLKLAMSQLGICERYTAAPFTTLNPDAEQAIRGDLQKAGVLG